MSIIDRYKEIALSDKEVLRLVEGRANIVLYPELSKMKSIDEALEPYGACFILFLSKPNYGHWCALIRRGKTLEFFNPYGGYPDDTLEYVPVNFRDKSNQNFTYLTKLLIDSPYDLEYNEHKFQKMKPNVKTCGRHSAFRIMMQVLSLDEYYEFLKILSKKLKLDFDELVTLLTMHINKK